MKKQYTSPKIKAVQLNAEQAIFNVCKVGGAYGSTDMFPTTVCYEKGTYTQPTHGCSVTVRVPSENWGSSSSTQALPS